MELPIEILKEIVFHTELKIEEHRLIFMNQSTHEEHLAQPSHPHIQQFKSAVTFLTVCNGIFNITSKIKKRIFPVALNDYDFIKIPIPPGPYEIESLDNEIKWIVFEEVYLTESAYPFTIKQNFSPQGSIIKISSNNIGSQYAFTPDDSIEDRQGLKPKLIHED